MPCRYAHTYDAAMREKLLEYRQLANALPTRRGYHADEYES
jgi:hypothetical protein